MTRPRVKIRIFKFLNLIFLIFFNFFILEKIEQKTKKNKRQKTHTHKSMIHRSHEPTSASEIIGAFRAAMIMSKTAKNSNERNNKSKSLLIKGGDYLKNIRNTMDIYDDILISIVVVGTAMLYYTTF